MASKQHDLVIIGGGPGGYVAALRAAQLGIDTACVELEERLGGTCLRVGCIPSKALLESSEQYANARDGLLAHGISCASVKLDLAKLMQRKDGIVAELTKGIDGLFKKNKIARYLGRAEITAPGVVSVDGDETVEITAKHILIATGSTPAAVPGVKLDGTLIGDSTLGLSFDRVPERLVVIGAGYIGMELGSVWQRLGSQVIVLEYLDRILPGTDSEIAREALRLFRKQGLDIRLQSRVTGVQTLGKGAKASCLVELDGGEPVACDRVLVVVGRQPNTAGLGLANVGVRTNERGFIQVDAQYATSVPGIYAVGDVIGGMMLAHKASHEGIACVETLAGGHGHVSYDAIPAVVYTEPEIASVGATEDALKTAGREYRKGVFMFRASGRAKALNQTEGRVKVLADAATDRLLGVHILGPRAGELIAECAMALEFGATAEDLARTCHAHPTLSEVVMEAALAAGSGAIHG
ncbi:dihydrolipoyl dehydrogenase [bacterium]|nr:dihydrolipoyl dehydrogenase [bacterium]